MEQEHNGDKLYTFITCGNISIIYMVYYENTGVCTVEILMYPGMKAKRF